MKAVKVIKPGDIQIVEEEMPKITDSHYVLVKVKAAGVCGSDISIFKGTSPVATYPRVIGHEFAGEVVEIGADVNQVQVGDHVSINPVIGCGKCRACKKGRSNVCENLTVIGVHTDGGFREYVAVPENNVFKISKDISWKQAAITEPYTIAAQVVSRGEVQPDDTVLIFGCGPIALTILQVSKMIGAKCIMCDIVNGRLERAKEYGADVVINSKTDDLVEKVMEITDGAGVDVAIDAACAGITFEQAVLCTGAAGIVISMGFSDKPSKIRELDITKKELDVRGSRLNNNKFPQVIEWVESGKIDSSKIITDSFYFTDVLKAFDKIKNDPDETLKVILTFDKE
jgi:L-gulonate 5-dehydrogenase